MATLTISDAARRCGVTRRTIQRAIQAGRLSLTSEHRLTRTALAKAGYLLRPDAATLTQGDTSQRQTQDTSQGTTQGPAPLLERLDHMLVLLQRLQETLAQHVAGSTHGTAPAAPPPVPPPPDPVLVQILAWHQEGLSLRNVAARLNAEGVPTRSGKGRWHQSNISRELARLKSST